MKELFHHVLVLATGCIFFVVSSAPAHDLWIIPAELSTTDKPLTIRINSGSDFPKGEHAPDPSTFVRRVLLLPNGNEGKLDAAGTEGNSGLVRFDPVHPGVYIVAVETKPKLITLQADAFNAYLVSDGLPHIFRLRAKEKTLDQPGKEHYTKSPKAFVQFGKGGSGDPCRVVGLPLEIVPKCDPFSLKAGDTLPVRVLFQGKILPEANLGWQLPGDGETPRGTVRTDAKGEALIPIAGPGLMTVRLTHMTRPKAEEFEWESFWTSMTFRVPEAGAPPHGH